MRRPVLLDPGTAPADAPRLAGGWVPVAKVEEGGATQPISAHPDLTAPRPEICGLSMDRPRIMGILNVTPDSFSDGGHHAGTTQALRHAQDMLEAGAQVIDVGGESTRSSPSCGSPRRSSKFPMV